MTPPMTPDEKLAAFFDADRAPAAAPAFNAAVMERVARRELVRALLTGAVLALGGGVALWATAPVLATALEPLSQSLLAGTGLLVATLSLVGLGERMLRKA
ncbi:MAG: hypothetical protein KF842_10025 [Caulobacter sp.]|nr:hypothetical protein [Caulobacter sp.]